MQGKLRGATRLIALALTDIFMQGEALITYFVTRAGAAA